ncbi:sugar phosphate isomerase/epimerase family protein [Actinomadura scrupuli]|uniref:sugar phosphate isomerase/epimerase family protein n=1 Tax=Actinomadura scrupuli TaxID=559629 RepID=UPI003D98EA22
MSDQITYAGITDEAAPRLADQVAALSALGWDTIELRSVDGVAIAELDDRAFGRLTEVLSAAGISVTCVDSRIANWGRPISGRFEDDLDELHVLAGRCAALGTRNVRVMSYPNAGLDEPDWGRRVIARMRELAAQAEDADLVLLHENCAGWAAHDPARMRRLVEEVGSPALRLLFDTGNGIAHGYEAYDVLTGIVDLVAHVHVKDGRGDAAAPVYTLPGEGDCRVADCLRLLLDHGYHGALSIEPHLHVRPHENRTDPGPDGLTQFVSYGRRLERLVEESVLPPRRGGP